MQKKKQAEAKVEEEYVPLMNRPETKKATEVAAPTKPENMTYNQFNKNAFEFFRGKEYVVFESFKEGYNKTVSEDFDSVDLLCNLNDLIVQSMSSDNMSVTDKLHLNNLSKGLQQLTKVYRQYDSNVNQVFVAKLCGYMLKLVRNHFHD